jgi:predicted transcriptional regulator
MKIHELFLELASKKRLDILQALGERPMKFTKLSKEFEMTSPEASRQLSRLMELRLIEKKGDGNYHITYLGKLVLSGISNLEFISKRSDYFLSHDTSPVPPHLLNQIDALSKGEVIIGVYEALNTTDKLFEDVKEYLWYIADDVPMHYLPRCEDKLDRGVTFRAILPEKVASAMLPTLSEKIREGIEVRVLDEVRIAIDVNDGFAEVALPGLDGKIDYGAVILGRDSGFRQWCNEVFEHYWEKAKPCEV